MLTWAVPCAAIATVSDILTNVNNDKSLAKAPTLQLLRTMLDPFKIKTREDVIKSLDVEAFKQLGITYNFGNQSSWYISFGKLFGGLIVQGGSQTAGKQKQSDAQNLEGTTNRVIFPISFPQKCLFTTFGIVASDTSVFWGNSAASCIIRKQSKTDMRYEVHSTYETMLKEDSNIQWLVIGY